MFLKIVIGKINFHITLLRCSCRRCCFASNSAIKSQLPSSAGVLFWKPQTEVPFARSARLFLALKKLLVMLSVAIANATVQHLVKEEGDVATRAQRRLLPEEFRGGFTLDIPRRLKKIHGVIREPRVFPHSWQAGIPPLQPAVTPGEHRFIRQRRWLLI